MMGCIVCLYIYIHTKHATGQKFLYTQSESIQNDQKENVLDILIPPLLDDILHFIHYKYRNTSFSLYYT